MSESLRHTLTIDDSWTRPLPPRWWQLDGVLAGVWFVLAAVTTESYRSVGALADDHTSVWLQYLYVLLPCAVIVVRRRFPLTTIVAVTALWVITGNLDGKLSITLGIQFVYLFGMYSAAAWCRNRLRGAWIIPGCLLVLFGWVAWVLVFDWHGVPSGSQALSARAGATIITVISNVVYLGGAVLLGMLEWRNLRRRTELEQQAKTIDAQAIELRQQAVDAERLRIARELHDVVAHHVSVMGVQAGAARRVLEKEPTAARDALAGIEQSSRSAVTEMRSLLGTLRSSSAPEPDRAPTPGLGELAGLIDGYRAAGLAVDDSVADTDPPLLPAVPPSVGLAIYRTVQEALANVQRHSTASSASVVTRFGRRGGRAYAEVEILDTGRSRHATEGTGLGLVGMRERASVLGGEVEIGPRATEGFRVRVRIPFQ